MVEELRVAAGDGRLTSDELDERLERALSARTYADLASSPPTCPPQERAGRCPGRRRPAKELITIHVSSGHAAREGRWTVPNRMDIKVTSGQVKLDLTEAVITQPALHSTPGAQRAAAAGHQAGHRRSTWTTWRCAVARSRSGRHGAPASR